LFKATPNIPINHPPNTLAITPVINGKPFGKFTPYIQDSVGPEIIPGNAAAIADVLSIILLLLKQTPIVAPIWAHAAANAAARNNDGLLFATKSAVAAKNKML